MKVVILCGGKGTRLLAETEYRPKPMVPIGEHPILWHIMNIYAAHGISEFIVCAGYKGARIKEYFANLLLYNGESHIAIYVGNGMIVDAPHTGATVEEIPESESWYADNLDGVVRP